MKDKKTASVATQMYTAAHAAQYQTKDLPAALALYQRIVLEHPDEKEAGYARSQIHRIASRVVPTPALLDAQVELALAHLNPRP